MTVKSIISASRAYVESVIMFIITLKNPPNAITSCLPAMRHCKATLLYTLAQAVLCVCYQAWGVTKGQHIPLSRSCSSLFPLQETQITQFVCDSRFKASRLSTDIHGISARGFTVRLSRYVGRLTALMAIKISGRMLTLEKATGNGRRWKREFTT